MVPLLAFLLFFSCGEESDENSSQRCNQTISCSTDQECLYTSEDPAIDGVCKTKVPCTNANETCSDQRICNSDPRGKLVCGGSLVSFAFKTAERLTDGTQNVPYNTQIELTGITGPFTIKLSSTSSLPEGLILATNGLLTGTPTTAGTFVLKIDAFNGADGVASYYNTIKVTKEFALIIKAGTGNPCDNITCSDHGTCAVVNNAATCNCEDGYTANGVNCVKDSDPCDDVTCSGHGTCAVINNAATCTCDDGYTAFQTKCIKSTCDGVECGTNGSCVVKTPEDAGVDVAICECNTGYHMNVDKDTNAMTCVVDSVGFCEGISCSNHGACIVSNEESCYCDNGYQSVSIDVSTDTTREVYFHCLPKSCDTVTCSGNGTCVVKDGVAACTCTDDYHTTDAAPLECIETIGDPCDGMTCSNHGTCAVDNGKAICNCDNGYTASGMECIEDVVNLCDPNPCDGTDDQYLTVCTVESDQAVCSCIEGYTLDGDKCIKDTTNPCENIDCSGHGTCEVVADAATCNCDDNYVANGLTCIPEGSNIALVINEVSPNATHPEYVELYNSGDTAVDLTAYTLEVGSDIFNIEAFNLVTTTLAAGEYAVIVENDYANELTIDDNAIIVQVSKSTLGITKTDDVVLKNGDIVMSSYTYDFDATASADLTAQRESFTSEDFCEATATAGSANNCTVVDPCEGVTCDGENEVCDAGNCVCDTGFHDEDGVCVEDSTDPCAAVVCDNGTCVAVEGAATCDCDEGFVVSGLTCIPKSSGDKTLIITEVMSNPNATTDTLGDWIEIYNTTDAAISLEGFKVRKNNSTTYTLSFSANFSVPAKSYFVIARSEAATSMLPVVDAVITTMSLTNNNAYPLEILKDTEVLDAITYNTTAGVSWQLDMSGNTWCESTTAISVDNTDLGSPGTENESCQ